MRLLVVTLEVPDDVRLEPSETRLRHLARDMAAEASREFGDLIAVRSIELDERT